MRGSELLVTEFNKPFTSSGLGNWFRKRCDETGLFHCSAHGLRKAAASRLADRGASEHQIMSMTGHTTSKEVTRYTKSACQKVLAKSAVGPCSTTRQSTNRAVQSGNKCVQLFKVV